MITKTRTDAEVIREALDGHFVVISAEKDDLPLAENRLRMRTLSNILTFGGFDVFPVTGKYHGKEEHSLFVPGLPDEVACVLGQLFQQNFFVSEAGLNFTDGSYHPSTGDMTINGSETDDYSVVYGSDGTSLKFSLTINDAATAW
jgi:hypothetical protein